MTVKFKKVNAIERRIVVPKINGNIILSSIFLYIFFLLPVITHLNFPLKKSLDLRYWSRINPIIKMINKAPKRR